MDARPSAGELGHLRSCSAPVRKFSIERKARIPTCRMRAAACFDDSIPFIEGLRNAGYRIELTQHTDSDCAETQAGGAPPTSQRFDPLAVPPGTYLLQLPPRTGRLRATVRELAGNLERTDKETVDDAVLENPNSMGHFLPVGTARPRDSSAVSLISAALGRLAWRILCKFCWASGVRLTAGVVSFGVVAIAASRAFWNWWWERQAAAVLRRRTTAQPPDAAVFRVDPLELLTSEHRRWLRLAANALASRRSLPLRALDVSRTLSLCPARAFGYVHPVFPRSSRHSRDLGAGGSALARKITKQLGPMHFWLGVERYSAPVFEFEYAGDLRVCFAKGGLHHSLDPS